MKFLQWMQVFTVGLRYALGVLVLLFAAKACIVMMTVWVTPDFGFVFLTRVLAAFGLILIGTLLLDGRNSK